MKPFIKQIIYGSCEFDEEIKLRNDILRKPLGLEFSQKQLEEEKRQFHFGAYLKGKLVGCLLLKPNSYEEIQMRQVAVVSDLQGMGIGNQLVNSSEEFARSRGYIKMTLNARDTAITFYEKLGYLKEGEEFIEVTIPHIKMYKLLS